MGWWWSSPSQKDEQQSRPQQPTPLEQHAPSIIPQQKPQLPSQEPSKSLAQDAQTDAELQELLAALEWTDNQDKSKSTESSSNSSTSSTQDLRGHASNHGPSKSIAPESLYPDEMSCRSAFDYAFFCQSFGGQWVNVYRYGELRSCSEHWENFWLCMQARSYPDDLRKKTIRDHYRKKAIKYKTGPSSEDVWDVRTEPLIDAFKGDFAAYERDSKEEQATAQP